MSLTTAAEDLKTTTLRSVAGMLAQLEYLSGLAQEDGAYRHWGLERTHGRATAQQALSDTHHELLAGVLRTSLRKLMLEAESSSTSRGLTPTAYLERLHQNAARLLPAHCSSGAPRHLAYALRALSGLLQTPTRPAA